MSAGATMTWCFIACHWLPQVLIIKKTGWIDQNQSSGDDGQNSYHYCNCVTFGAGCGFGRPITSIQDNMALFFDNQWFDAQLAALGLDRGAVAARLSISAAEVDLLFKDQREMSAEDVLALADLLGHSAEEIADRAGVSTPTPRLAPAGPGADTARLTALEAQVTSLQAELLRLRDKIQGLEFALRSSGTQTLSDKELD